MIQPTPLDLAIGGILLVSILGACHRGIGREMLHTVLFTLLVAVGYVLFRNAKPVESETDAVFWAINSLYYLITAYALTWVGMKILSPFVLGEQSVGMRSRFWAGVLSVTKLAAVIFGINLWFAMHSEAAHPQRLESLPPVMQKSVAIRISDKLTEDLYRWLAAKNVVEYKKVVYKEQTEDERRQKRLEETLGIAPTGE